MAIEIDNVEWKGIKYKFEPKKWITEGIDKNAIYYTEWMGKTFTEGKEWENLTTSQVRNFFGEMRRIQMKWNDNDKTALYMLKPKLAYAKGRVKGNNRIADFEKIAKRLIDHVEEKKHFDNLVSFMESFVAYHKYYGGK